MSKTYDLLNKIIGKVNASVKTEKQTLTEAQKAQARTNLGIASTSEIVQLVIESLGGNPVFGIVDENNNIIVSGNLPDGTYSVKYEMEDGKTVNIGNLVLDTNVYYSVTNNLTNCVSSNSAKQAIAGQSYSATITANSGYELKSVSVTMGGSAVSVSGGAINIANVTGNIVITAVAEEVKAKYNNLANPNDAYWKEGYRISLSSGGTTACTGRTATNFIPAKPGDVLRVKGMDLKQKLSSQDGKIVMYETKDDESSKLGGLYCVDTNNNDSCGQTITINGDISTITLLTANNGTQPENLKYMNFIRIDGVLLNGYTKNDVIITINEEITD